MYLKTKTFGQLILKSTYFHLVFNYTWHNGTEYQLKLTSFTANVIIYIVAEESSVVVKLRRIINAKVIGTIDILYS